MTLQEYINTEKRFNKLFNKRCKNIPFTTEEEQEYIRLVNILAESDRQKEFYELIARGDYRIGY